ncbi:hypothetical protein QS257_14475 [Terrilactibacillus sp. S3-3]|nr:hypothetical protein QS257_14475 [Terrilactibacillus sp. S3-3]
MLNKRDSRLHFAACDSPASGRRKTMLLEPGAAFSDYLSPLSYEWVHELPLSAGPFLFVPTVRPLAAAKNRITAPQYMV